MTPLTDALTTAQRRALAALEKAYVAEAIDADELRQQLAGFGVDDPIDVSFLTHALDVCREWGVGSPTMTERVVRETEPMSTKQREYIEKLAQEKKMHLRPGFEGMSKEQASQTINELQAGTYDQQAHVPF